MTVDVLSAPWGQAIRVPRTAHKSRGVPFWYVVTPLIYIAFLAALLLERPGSVEHAYHGTILIVSPDRLVLTTRDEYHGFEIATDAIISLDGIPAGIADLRTGHLVDVIAEQDEQEMVAKVIEAFRNH